MERKQIFDAVRAMLGRGFEQSEVAALDQAIDRALNPGNAEPNGQLRRTSQRGVNLIKEFEGCARIRPDGTVEAYQDPVGIWTIGWGATGPDIRKGTVWTQAQCDARLLEDVARHAKDVVRALDGAPTTQNQFDALVSFHYNTGAINKATLTKKHKAGDYEGAAAEFARWNKAGGRVLPGLTRRRAAEAELYRRKD